LTKSLQKGEDTIQLQIWDTAGTERYNSMGQSFYRNSEACVLVFDLTLPDSFKNVENWRKDFLSSLNPPDPDTYPFILVGNKSDIKNNILVNNDEIDAYCKEHNNMPYFATSAKEDINLEETFAKVADLAYERNTKNEDNFVPVETKFLKVNKEEPKKNKCGCGN
jgi:Ras-related protein Rab-7A